MGYSGRSVAKFFHEKGTKDIAKELNEVYQMESAFTAGVINAHNPHEDYIKGETITSEAHEEALYWTPNLKTATNYPRHLTGVEADHRVTLEICMPADGTIHYDTESEKRWENLEDLKKDFGNPQKYRNALESSIGSIDSMHFKVARYLEEYQQDRYKTEPALPMDYVTGIWDHEIFPDTPQFLDRDHYWQQLHRKYPDRVPAPGNKNSIVDYKELEIKNEIEILRNKLVNSTKKLRNLNNTIIAESLSRAIRHRSKNPDSNRIKEPKIAEKMFESPWNRPEFIVKSNELVLTICEILYRDFDSKMNTTLEPYAKIASTQSTLKNHLRQRSETAEIINSEMRKMRKAFKQEKTSQIEKLEKECIAQLSEKGTFIVEIDQNTPSRVCKELRSNEKVAFDCKIEPIAEKIFHQKTNEISDQQEQILEELEAVAEI